MHADFHIGTNRDLFADWLLNWLKTEKPQPQDWHWNCNVRRYAITTHGIERYDHRRTANPVSCSFGPERRTPTGAVDFVSVEVQLSAIEKTPGQIDVAVKCTANGEDLYAAIVDAIATAYDLTPPAPAVAGAELPPEPAPTGDQAGNVYEAMPQPDDGKWTKKDWQKLFSYLNGLGIDNFNLQKIADVTGRKYTYVKKRAYEYNNGELD